MCIKESIEKYAAASQEEIAQILRDLCKLPAPSHHEELRAEFCKNWFVKNGFDNVCIDEALNVIAPVNVDDHNDLTVVMAHMDTVFPDTEPMPFVEENGIMHCPGVNDDSANLSVLMAGARFFKDNFPAGKNGYLFVANSCEEGLGNLKGCRKIMETYGSRVREFISLDSSCMNRVVTRAVGSHRYRVTVKTEGGHSFSCFGNKNAIHTLASMIDLLYTVKVPVEGDSTTTYNVGLISGGTSVNTIAQNAEMTYEYRSDNKNCLEKMEKLFNQVIETFRAAGVEVDVEKIGDRPCGSLIDPERFAELLKKYTDSVRDVLEMEVIEGSSSTDCNIPLAMGIPAICFGVCRGGNVHTRSEWVETASLSEGCKLMLDFLYR